MKDRMSDGGDDFHLFVEDVCVHSLFVFPLRVFCHLEAIY